MSSTVRSYGYIAVLANPIPEDQIEDVAEALYDSKTCIRLNNEGTLVYSDLNVLKKYSEREDFCGLSIGVPKSEQTEVQFLQAALEAELPVKEGSMAQPYNCIWYNGSDNPVDLLTKEKFLK